MNIFQLIKSVLDEIYERILGEPAEKDRRIKVQIEALRAAFARLAAVGVPNNYADAVTRFAYIYKYVTSHANVVYQLVRNCSRSSACSQLSQLFDREQISITCVGGGPGSDFLGIVKYIIKNGKTPHLRVNLFEREPAWNECWSDIDEKLKSQLLISSTFTPFDVTATASWSSYQKFLSSDLFTMIYFMSEINSLREQAVPFFANLFANAKPGALILYVDNNHEAFYGWFDSLVSAHNWTVLMSEEETLGMEDLTEEKADLEPYYSKFGVPKLTANIAYRVCQKQ